MLCDMCPTSVRSLASTGSMGQRLVSNFNKRAYRIELFLRPFFTFTQYITFQVIQTFTGLLISGLSALQFMDRTVYEGSDLDLYVHYRSIRHVGSARFVIRMSDVHLQVHEWLISIGYQFMLPSTYVSFDSVFQQTVVLGGIPLDSGPRIYTGTGILGVFKYLNGHGKKIDVIATLFTPLHAILGFHSSK